MGGWLEQRRALLVFGYGFIAGGWVYVAIRVGHGLEAGWIVFVVLTILVGGIVRRWWALLGVVGPMTGFVALELTSDFGHGDWRELAVFSLPTLFFTSLIAAALLLGRAAGEGLVWANELHRKRRDGPPRSSRGR